jgi:DNA-binding NtrC family response regulator
MPAEVLVVHPDNAIAFAVAHAFQARGRTVRHYADPLLAMTALERADLIELLVTCVEFDDERSNGQALALMTRSRHPNAKFLFMCEPGQDQHVSDLGECVALPADVASVVDKGEELLQDRSAPAPVV